jgi:hypothetical protein
MAQVTLGQTLPFTVAYVDQNGAPIVPAAGAVAISTTDVAVADVLDESPTAEAGSVTPAAVGTCDLTALMGTVVIPLAEADGSSADVVVVAAPTVTSGTVTFGPPV